MDLVLIKWIPFKLNESLNKSRSGTRRLDFERADFEKWKNLVGEVIWAEKHENLTAEPLSNAQVQKLSGHGIPGKGGKRDRQGLLAEARE